jgi:hypothetical protein
MRILGIILLAAAIVMVAAGAGAVDDGGEAGSCRCEASHLLGSGCAVFGPCPCTCRCPLIGGCSCVCAGNQLDNPPAG